jgi:hypothetical protein
VLDAKCLVVLDSDLRSITPEWIELLAGPVLLKGYDLVTPHYARHKYDGTITNNVVYPLVRSMFGKRIRQPIGGDFGLSPELVRALLAKDVWETDVARFGIDIFATVTALAEGLEVCEAFLGAKIHDPKDPASSLSDMFRQVVGTLFELSHQNAETCLQVEGSRPVPQFGFKSEIAPVAVEVSVAKMLERFQEGVVQFEDDWRTILRREELDGVLQAAKLPASDYRFPIDLWVHVVYTYLAKAPRLGTDQAVRDRYIQSLVPLYFARTASFVLETGEMRTAEAEQVIEQQGSRFEELKRFLHEVWRGRGARSKDSSGNGAGDRQEISKPARSD